MFQRIAAGQGGAILSGDGEILMPPVLQPVVQASSPFDSCISVGTTVTANQSFFGNDGWVASGIASLGAARTFATLGGGLWRFDFNWEFFFSGTTNNAGAAAVILVDPESNFRYLVRSFYKNGFNCALNFGFNLTLPRPGFTFRLAITDTVALDELMASVQVAGAKLT